MATMRFVHTNIANKPLCCICSPSFQFFALCINVTFLNMSLLYVLINHIYHIIILQLYYVLAILKKITKIKKCGENRVL
jgi:hypothetical protein